jgi:hypothetical protein
VPPVTSLVTRDQDVEFEHLKSRIDLTNKRDTHGTREYLHDGGVVLFSGYSFAEIVGPA